MATDFEKWRVGYDGGADARRAAGWHGTQIYQGEQNPNEMVLIYDWNTEENFKKFVNSPYLKELQERAGLRSNYQAYTLRNFSSQIGTSQNQNWSPEER